MAGTITPDVLADPLVINQILSQAIRSSLTHFQVIAAALVLVATLVCIVARPRQIHVAWPAGIGAVLAFGFGLLSPHALLTIFSDTWDAAAPLIALCILSETLASNGFFAWAALRLARLARGDGWRLSAAGHGNEHQAVRPRQPLTQDPRDGVGLVRWLG